MIEMNGVNLKRLIKLWWACFAMLFVAAFLEGEELLLAEEA